MPETAVCIRKISGSVEVTSRSCPTFLQSQIFYVRTFAGYLLPNRGFQLPPCPAVLSVSALRAGALALAPTCTGPRTGRGAGPAWRPVRPPALSWGGHGSAFLLNQLAKVFCRGKEENEQLKEPARKKKQKREKDAESAAATAGREGASQIKSRSVARPPGRPARGRTEQQRDAAVTAGLGNALGGTRPPQKPGQLVLDGREPRGGEKRKQLFVAALFASFVCCSQMTNRSLRLSTQFI